MFKWGACVSLAFEVVFDVLSRVLAPRDSISKKVARSFTRVMRFLKALMLASDCMSEELKVEASRSGRGRVSENRYSG